jgi:hypothetical protein
MRPKTKVIMGIVGTVALVLMLPLLAILPWAASNAVSAAYYLLFTTQPTHKDLTGEYEATLIWGTAKLTLYANNTFEESLVTKGQEAQTIRGNWQSESGDVGHASVVTMSPDLEILEDKHGQQFSFGTHTFYKPRFGRVFAELDPDLGIRFTKRQE